ncbi:hypothetical protein A1F94_003034 [Pyrenophora tritici-repentis]|uniref:Uncharacterized protein n=1 Tax=Pyrenophora tritici-repentis TaxID=45151 RepID=A0A2W1FC85_9PLEO|nr:hypothetical protein A1F99_037040 [Pyrenophora tritici-repentis]KAG9386284.1 hypothetical protein A1F94_003034 [Pyrenophora tritici-repentis]KAI1519004.1 hypothetical protein Ptr86124_002132 [Pyrenophora tritici-repentis]KAI1672554.1 hypothetical protein L13192_03413 [Pyrenophora tritici-repentis]KAI1686580.1 hypothetical protein KJE20_04545 [Pyrenophora tritici-repentis]
MPNQPAIPANNQIYWDSATLSRLQISADPAITPAMYAKITEAVEKVDPNSNRDDKEESAKYEAEVCRVINAVLQSGKTQGGQVTRTKEFGTGRFAASKRLAILWEPL